MKGPDPDRHHRRSIRLKGYDYSGQGTYFVTICSQDRGCLFGDIVDGEMRMNCAGRLVQTVWNELPDHYSPSQLDESVVMPNHVHGIVLILGAEAVAPASGSTPAGAGLLVRAGLKPAPTRGTTVPGDHPVPATATTTRHGLTEIVRAFKTFSARRINEWRGTPGVPVWQRNYHEHIIRDESSLRRIREYIATNPVRWMDDPENPAARRRKA